MSLYGSVTYHLRMTRETDSPPLSFRTLLVSADADYADWLRPRLRDETGYSVTHVESAAEMFTEETGAVDCIVADASLAAPDVVTLLEVVRARRPEQPFVLLADTADEELVSDAISVGVTEYVAKDRRRTTVERLAAVLEGAVVPYRRFGAVHEREGHARAVLKAAPDAVLVVRDGVVEYANSRTADVLAYSSPEYLQGRTVADVLDLAGDESAVEALTDPDASDGIVQHEERLTRQDGATVPVTLSTIGLDWGGSAAVLLVVRDISDRGTLREELLRKNLAMDAAPVGITIGEPRTEDGDTPLIYLNDAYERLTGYTEREALGRDCRFLQGEGTDAETVSVVREAIDRQTPTTVEILNYRKDGAAFWNRLTVAPVEMEDEVYYVGFQDDVTDQMERRQDLRRFRRATEAAGQAFFITDTDGTITHVNPAFERITGYDKEDAIGETPAVLQSGQQSDEYYERLWETVLGGDIWEGDIVDERANGEFYYAHQTISPLVDDDGEVEEFVALQTDITERRERDRQLNALDRVLRHNLRNELTVIEGLAEQIQATGDDELTTQAAGIVDAAERLLQTADKGRRISELLASSTRPASADLVPIVTRVVETARAEHPHADVTTDLPETAVVETVGLIDEALTELVENAIVHNDTPTPTVCVRVDADEEGVTVHVVDDGPGIPEGDRTVLTDAQFDEAELFHGSGMGLWLVYWVVRRSRGQLGFDEEDRAGSHVTLTLERASPDADCR